MVCNIIGLKDFYPVKGGVLKGVCIDNPWDIGHKDWSRPALIVVPGGGYQGTSRREGEVVATHFLAQGFQVFVLEYLCRPQGVSYPEQLFELCCAIDYVRKNASEYNINPNEIFTLGFSAGGHLVADQSDEYESVSERIGVPLDCKPTAVGLGYPVIDEHDGSFENLLFGYDKTTAEKLNGDLKLNTRVGKYTPPTFVWTTAEDNLVPVGNSLRYALALAENSIPFELHVYQKGLHGLSTGSLEINEESDALKPLSAWISDCVRFFRSYISENF